AFRARALAFLGEPRLQRRAHRREPRLGKHPFHDQIAVVVPELPLRIRDHRPAHRAAETGIIALAVRKTKRFETGRPVGQAARTAARTASTRSFSWPAWAVSAPVASSTCAAAVPVSPAAAVTPPMLCDTSWVPPAAC